MSSSDPAAEQFGKKVHELRKARGWKQQELAKKLGTSGVIVGRYERGEMLPSIKVAQRIAEILGVTVDYMVGAHDIPDILNRRDMIERWKSIEALAEDDRSRIIFVIDSLIREATTREAFASTSTSA